MKSFEEIQNYFDSMTNEELIDYHNELASNNPDFYDVVNEALIACYGEVNYNDINKLHWHFAKACVNRLKI
jgi:hypothetical protein